jgi:hypothetical protein
VTSNAESERRKGFLSSAWFRVLVVIVCVVTPSALARGLMEAPIFSPSTLEEPQDSVRTPNPAKAPWVLRGYDLMVYVNPRAAFWAWRWSYLPLLAALGMGLVAPQVVSRREILIPASIAFGVVMAWPWLWVWGTFFLL